MLDEPAAVEDRRPGVETDTGVFGPIIIIVLPGLTNLVDVRRLGIVIDTGVFGPIIIFVVSGLVAVDTSGLDVGIC